MRSSERAGVTIGHVFAGTRHLSSDWRLIMKLLFPVVLVVVTLGPVSAQTTGHGHGTAPDQAIYLKYPDIKWDRTNPELGDASPKIAILHVDRRTGATKLMIDVPRNFHVPKHWHTANETHTIVSGTFIMSHDGKREELGVGSFNYVPSRMVHEAWTKPDEGALLFITVDGPWDLNWVEGPPRAPSN
jgi:mannose-6-phosphate isomerase-like protein (cupin superfamily)